MGSSRRAAAVPAFRTERMEGCVREEQNNSGLRGWNYPMGAARREGERGRRGQQEKTTKTRGKVDMEWRTSDRAVAWEEKERVVWMGMSRGAAAVPRLQAAGAKGAGKERTAREESEEDKEEGGHGVEDN